MMKTLTVLTAMAALVMVRTADASDKPYFRDVKGRIELAGASLASTGWKLEQVFTGSLTQGGAGWATLPLVPGREYRIVGRCDDDCGDLDLVLARDQQPLARDLDHDERPSLVFHPRSTGDYTVIARMVECEAPTCRYGLALFAR